MIISGPIPWGQGGVPSSGNELSVLRSTRSTKITPKEWFLSKNPLKRRKKFPSFRKTRKYALVFNQAQKPGPEKTWFWPVLGLASLLIG